MGTQPDLEKRQVVGLNQWKLVSAHISDYRNTASVCPLCAMSMWVHISEWTLHPHAWRETTLRCTVHIHIHNLMPHPQLCATSVCACACLDVRSVYEHITINELGDKGYRGESGKCFPSPHDKRLWIHRKLHLGPLGIRETSPTLHLAHQEPSTL